MHWFLVSYYRSSWFFLQATPKEQCAYAFFMPDSPGKSILSRLNALFYPFKNNTLATQVVMSYMAGCYALQKSQLIFIASFSDVVRDRRGYDNSFIIKCFCYLFKNLSIK